MRMFLFWAGLAAAVPATAQSSDGPTLYKRCSACHLPTGAGVPGTFPPLDAHLGKFAGTPEGRAYLVLVVTRGISGELKVGPKTYRGFMPAQNLKPADTATLLNHLLDKFASAGLPKQWRQFTKAEVSAVRTKHAAAKPADLHQMRKNALAGK